MQKLQNGKITKIINGEKIIHSALNYWSGYSLGPGRKFVKNVYINDNLIQIFQLEDGRYSAFVSFNDGKTGYLDGTTGQPEVFSDNIKGTIKKQVELFINIRR